MGLEVSLSLSVVKIAVAVQCLDEEQSSSSSSISPSASNSNSGLLCPWNLFVLDVNVKSSVGIHGGSGGGGGGSLVISGSRLSCTVSYLPPAITATATPTVTHSLVHTTPTLLDLQLHVRTPKSTSTIVVTKEVQMIVVAAWEWGVRGDRSGVFLHRNTARDGQGGVNNHMGGWGEDEWNGRSMLTTCRVPTGTPPPHLHPPLTPQHTLSISPLSIPC